MPEPKTIHERSERGQSGLLPPSVRLLAAPSGALCEFEVVSGNAAYREGERFYLTPERASRAYPTALIPGELLRSP